MKSVKKMKEGIRMIKSNDKLKKKSQSCEEGGACRGVVVITTAQLHSTKPGLRFCAGSNPARGVSEIRDGEDLWQWSQLEIRLNAFHRLTIPQKQFIIIIIITHHFIDEL